MSTPKDQLDRYIDEIYDEIYSLAKSVLCKEFKSKTITPTMLVSETYIRLAKQERKPWKDKRSVVAAAVRAMRRILVDYARYKKASKRGKGIPDMPLVEEILDYVESNNLDVIHLNEILEKLGRSDPRLLRIVELKVFGGFSISEIAEVVGISPTTVKREWAFAKAWLLKELDGERDE